MLFLRGIQQLPAFPSLASYMIPQVFLAGDGMEPTASSGRRREGLMLKHGGGATVTAAGGRRKEQERQ